MPAETGTRFKDWVDHRDRGDSAPSIASRPSGYERQRATYAVGVPVFAHANGIFPADCAGAPRRWAERADLVVSEVAIKVERVADFSRAHDLGLEIVGYPMGPYRVGRVPGDRTTLAAVERRGYLGFEPFPGELAREAG